MKKLTLQATLENIPAVTAFIDEQLEALGCPMKAQMQIDVAIDELFSNIARYAYEPGTGDVTVRLDTQEQPKAVIITFIDSGTPFNPLVAEMPDISLSAEDRPIGGLGIHLVRKTMDDMHYERTDHRNVLSIQKNL